MANNLYNNPYYNFLQPGPMLLPLMVRISTLTFEDPHQLKVQPQQVSHSLVASLTFRLIFLSLVHNIAVQVPVNDTVNRDIVFPSNIPHHDFHDRIMAAMNLDPATAQLGWKTNDEGKHSLAHKLITNTDIDNAFKTITDIQNNPPGERKFLWRLFTW